MPLEINEIELRLQVGEAPTQLQSASSDGVTSSPYGTGNDAAGESDNEALIAACTRRVLQQLKHNKER
jgi:hypothetical protein